MTTPNAPIVSAKATPTPAENHKIAAKHHEEAAKHHHEAAKHHDANNHEKACESTLKANGHHSLAGEINKDIYRHHAQKS